MRKFLIILVCILLLMQTPIAQKYVDTYFRKSEYFVKRLLDTEQGPSSTTRNSRQYTSTAPADSRATVTPTESSSNNYSQNPFGMNYKGESSPLSGSRGSY